MGVAEIIQIAQAGIKGLTDLYAAYEAGKAVLSETDLAKIKATLAQAQALTNELAPKVDAALDAASKR